ncbi:hypothetical protein IWQ55_006631 [Labrenzia sp. EL_208]|nr:hypothetical protein [Labrenzia sp. EL_132]MBG6233389.1 hypothetical protein [Labrenzia sp. EL_208]
MTALDEFYKVLHEYPKLLTWSLGSSAALPLIAKFSGFSPTWPPATTALTSLFVLVAIMLSFQFLRQKGRRRVSKNMVISLIIAAIAFVFYLYIFARFTYPIPTTGDITYLGCGWSELAKSQAEKYLINPDVGCPGEFERILEAIEYEAGIIWTKESIANVRLGVALSWFTFFGSLSYAIGAFIVHQANKS